MMRLPSGASMAQRFPALARTRHLSRRSFLTGAAAFGGATLVGCSQNGNLAFDDVDLGRNSDLVILTWPDYIDPLGDGNTTLGNNPVAGTKYLELWTDNVTGWDLIRPGLEAGSRVSVDGNVVDIAIPTNWLAARMVERGYVEALPLEVIPNHKNIDPTFLTLDWDRGARFHMPWQSGITGIAYRPDKVEAAPTTLVELFERDRPWTGRVGMIGEMREAVGLAMLALGTDPSQPTLESARAGFDFLVDREDILQKWYFDDFVAGLGDDGPDGVDVTMAWSGNTLLIDQYPVEFLVPDEGAIQWFDTMVILKGSERLAAAGAWMDYVYDPTVAADITSYVGYVSPVLDVKDLIAGSDDEDVSVLAQSELVFPSAETRKRLFTWGTMSSVQEDQLEIDFFNAFGEFLPE